MNVLKSMHHLIPVKKCNDKKESFPNIEWLLWHQSGTIHMFYSIAILPSVGI